MEGSDTFCVQSDVMRFRNVPFEGLGQETWMYAAFNQGGVGVSKESVMHHFAAEPVLKSAPTGLNVFSRYLRYYLRWLDQEQLVVVGEHENQEKAKLLNTKTQEVSDYNYQPQGEHPFQWQGHTYSGVQNLVDGGRSVVFPASDERSPPLTLKFSEDPANHFSLFTDGLETFFAARTNNSLQVYQLEEQGFALIKQIPQDPAKRNYVAWTDDGRYLLQYQTRKALLYERKGRDITFVSELTTPDQFLSCINTDPLFNRKVILSWQDQFICANGERISLMDPKSGDSTLIYQSSGPSEDRITDWRLSPDKRTLAVMNNSGKIMLFPMKASDQKKDVCLYLKDFFTSSNIFDSDPDFAREDQRLCE
jgi:WD40 repeat protein